MAIVGLAVAPANAQTQSTTTTSYIQSSTVLGSKIKDSSGQDVGEIKDFVLDRNTGCLAYVVVSTSKSGGTAKTVAAPWTVFASTSEPRVYTTRIEREKIYSAPVWESTRVEEYSRTEYLNSVYGYYGVTAPRFSAEVNMSTGTTSTAAATTNATAAPTASPLATPRPASSPSAAASVTPAVNATAKPIASASPAATAASTTAPAASSPKPSKTTSSAASPSKKKSDETTSKKTEKATKTETSKPDTAATESSTTEKSESTKESPSSRSTKKSTKKTAEPETPAPPKD